MLSFAPTNASQFVTHLYQLGNAVQKTLEAYTIHTEAVLGGRVKYDELHIRRLVESAVTSTHALIGPPDEDGKRKRKKREPRPLGMPKRPNTAFFRFQLEVRAAYRARNEEKSPGEIENLMKDAWNAMSEAQKQVMLRCPNNVHSLSDTPSHTRMPTRPSASNTMTSSMPGRKPAEQQAMPLLPQACCPQCRPMTSLLTMRARMIKLLFRRQQREPVVPPRPRRLPSTPA